MENAKYAPSADELEELEGSEELDDDEDSHALREVESDMFDDAEKAREDDIPGSRRELTEANSLTLEMRIKDEQYIFKG